MIEVKKTCSIPGCDDKLVARGLCDKHYCRWKRHGSTEQTRPKDWGKREKHPLYGTWTWHRRSFNVERLCEEWYGDFWLFVKDVVGRPSKNHFLRAIRHGEKLSPTNSHWVEGSGFTNPEETRKHRREYGREWRKNNPDKVLSSRLKRYFGISLETYEKMVEVQNGLCAICGKAETVRHNVARRVQELAVDHDHVTGKVRALLCSNCNTGLGDFNDDPDLLVKAAIYLEKHKVAEAPESEVA